MPMPGTDRAPEDGLGVAVWYDPLYLPVAMSPQT
jgi:hypothetical protein